MSKRGAIVNAPASPGLAEIVRRQRNDPPSLAHKPTPEMRELARLWAEVGASSDLIAAELGIGTETLRRHYSAEISGGIQRGVANMATALYEKGLRGDVTAQIFYLKTQGLKTGWLERQEQKPDTIVQLDIVKTITQTISALRQGTMPATLPQARVIEQAAPPGDDGADLV